jgi:glycerol kinase
MLMRMVVTALGSPMDQLPDAEAQARHVEQQQQDVGTRQLPVEVVVGDDAALVGDVEAAQLGVHQRQQHRPRMYQASTVS